MRPAGGYRFNDSLRALAIGHGGLVASYLVVNRSGGGSPIALSAARFGGPFLCEKRVT